MESLRYTTILKNLNFCAESSQQETKYEQEKISAEQK